MTDQERIAQLEAENAALRHELRAAQATMTRLQARIGELEARLAKDSQNSSKPPASDGLGRRLRRVRTPSGKRAGGQVGHVGHTLTLVETPDVVVRHAPVVCPQCQSSLEAVAGTLVERLQVHDLPPLRLEVTEHQVEQVCCPACGTQSRGAFPAAVGAPAQYGLRVRAAAVYLNH